MTLDPVQWTQVEICLMCCPRENYLILNNPSYNNESCVTHVEDGDNESCVTHVEDGVNESCVTHVEDAHFLLTVVCLLAFRVATKFMLVLHNH